MKWPSLKGEDACQGRNPTGRATRTGCCCCRRGAEWGGAELALHRALEGGWAAPDQAGTPCLVSTLHDGPLGLTRPQGCGEDPWPPPWSTRPTATSSGVLTLEVLLTLPGKGERGMVQGREGDVGEFRPRGRGSRGLPATWGAGLAQQSLNWKCAQNGATNKCWACSSFPFPSQWSPLGTRAKQSRCTQWQAGEQMGWGSEPNWKRQRGGWSE